MPCCAAQPDPVTSRDDLAVVGREDPQDVVEQHAGAVGRAWLGWIENVGWHGSRLTMREQIIIRISLGDDVLLRWSSCEDYSAPSSLPSKQRVAGSNPAGRAELWFTCGNAARRRLLSLLPLLRELLIGLDAIGSGSAALGCVNIGAYSLATLATALRQQITGDRLADGANSRPGSV